MRSGLTIVMPAHNEAATLSGTLERLFTHIHWHDWSDLVELIVVDDHSTDDTWAVACRLSILWGERMRLLENRYRRGYAGAVQTGIMSASRARVVVMTADGADDVTLLATHLYQTDAILFGNRWAWGRPPTYPRGKHILNRLGNWAIGLWAGTPYYFDWTDPYKSYPTAWAVEALPFRARGLGMSAGLELALYVTRAHPTAIIGIVRGTWQEREGGTSKFKLRSAWEYLLTALQWS
jgi:glycosyltransferase involved in cell wall biosynthesis